jgi:hypothetical protein
MMSCFLEVFFPAYSIALMVFVYKFVSISLNQIPIDYYGPPRVNLYIPSGEGRQRMQIRLVWARYITTQITAQILSLYKKRER